MGESGSGGARVVDVRAVAAAPGADARVVAAWQQVGMLAASDAPEMGLLAGDRPAADVEVLASCFASAEYELARRMHAAAVAGCLPLQEPGAVLSARGWSRAAARRIARAAALAASHASLAAAWAAGLICSEHLDPVARSADRFTSEELAAVIGQLTPHWGTWSPPAVARFVTAADRLLHPPPDPSGAELDAYQTRNVSFALTSDSVLISGELPRLEGELVLAALEAFAERLRSAADHVPAGARRADALVALVNAAAAAGALPTRAGLPVSLTVSMAHTSLGDPVVTSSRGHLLTDAETRWVCCDAMITPVLVDAAGCATLCGGSASDAGARDPIGGARQVPETVLACPAASTAPSERAERCDVGIGAPSPTARIAALAAALFDPPQPLAVGRSTRTASPAQRRALALRDKGCIIPGCSVPAEACQAHHLTDWAEGGNTDLSNLSLLCWAHHRQVDLNLWRLTPAAPLRAVETPPGSWPANNGAPFHVTRTPRSTWRN